MNSSSDKNQRELVKALEKALDKKEKEIDFYKRREATLKETSRDGIMIVSVTGKLLDVNHAFSEITGIPRNEVVGKSGFALARKFLGPNDLPTMLDLLKKLLLGQDVPDYVVQLNGRYLEISSPQHFVGRGEIFSFIRDITQRKKAEGDLRASEQRYRQIFENIQDVYYETGLDGTILEVSPSITNISEFSREELIGRSLYTIYANPPDRDMFVAKLKDHEIVSDYEVVLKDKNGTAFSCSVTARLVSGPAGVPEKICGILRNISARKRMENMLAESESLYRSLVEQSPVSIARVNAEGKFVFVNKQFLAWSGLGMEEVVGRGPEILCPHMTPDSFCTMIEAVSETREKRSKTECELLFNLPGGGHLWVMQLAFPWHAADGTLLGVVVQGHDITKRKQAETFMKESSETFSRIFNLGPLISVITTVNEGMFLEVNDAFVKISGYSREEVIGKSSLEFAMVSKEEREMAVRRLLKEGFSINEAPVRLKSGEVRSGLFYAKPIVYQGHYCQILNVIDITDLKRGQEALQRSYHELEQRVKERTEELSLSNAALQYEIEEREKAEEQRKIAEEYLQRAQKLESLGVLSGGIAHDFNNLLTGIFGTISLARLSAAPGSEVAGLLDQTLSIFSRAQNLTRQLLTFSKGGHPFKKTQPVDTLIKESSRFALTGTDISLHFTLPSDLWPCEIDENQISQVIDNIVINARQAMPTGGTITITASNCTLQSYPPLAPGNYVKISIQDEGCGISSDHLHRIFDPFFTTKQEGSGLGLAIAYSIVHKHGGYITVDSTLGKGSTFEIYLPAFPGFVQVPEAEASPTSKPHGRILAMDDEEYIRIMWKKILEGAGYTVEVAPNGETAIETYQKARSESMPFDLVILDLTIQNGMGGKATMERLLAIDPSVKAIATSGYSDDPVLTEFKRFGFKNSLAKPFIYNNMLRVLQETMEAK